MKEIIKFLTVLNQYMIFMLSAITMEDWVEVTIQLMPKIMENGMTIMIVQFVDVMKEVLLDLELTFSSINVEIEK